MQYPNVLESIPYVERAEAVDSIILYKSAAVRGSGDDLVQMYQGLLLLLALYNSAFNGLLECRMSPYAADCPSHSPTGTVHKMDLHYLHKFQLLVSC